MKTLHNDALKSLIAVQYYMSTISNNSNENVRTEQYGQCLEVMSNAVNVLIKTAGHTPKEHSKYPDELLLIMKNISNINHKVESLRKTDRAIYSKLIDNNTLAEKI